MLVTACVSADTVSARHIPFQTGDRLLVFYVPATCLLKTSRQRPRIAILDVLDQAPRDVLCTLNWRLWARKTNGYLPLAKHGRRAEDETYIT